MALNWYGSRQRLMADRLEMARRMREYFDEFTRGHRVSGWGATGQPGAAASLPLLYIFVSYGDAQWTILDGDVNLCDIRERTRKFFEHRGYTELPLNTEQFPELARKIVDLRDKQGFRITIRTVDATEKEVSVRMTSPLRWRLNDPAGLDLSDPAAQAMNWRVEG